MATVNHLQEHFKSEVERMETQLKIKDKELSETKKELRLAAQNHDSNSRCFNEAIMDIYEDVRTLIKRYIPSKVPPRDESSIDAQANDISSMLRILKDELGILTRKCRNAEQKENDLMKRVTTQTAVSNETRKQLEIIKVQFDEQIEKLRTEKYRSEDELHAKIREKNMEIAHLNLRVEKLQRLTGIDPRQKPTTQHQNPMQNVQNQADLLDSKLKHLEEQVNQQSAELLEKDKVVSELQLEISKFKRNNIEKDKVFRELLAHFNQKEGELKGEKEKSQEFENALETYKQEINKLKQAIETDKEVMKSERAKEKEELRTQYERIMQERVTKAHEEGERKGFEQAELQKEKDIEQLRKDTIDLENKKSAQESKFAVAQKEIDRLKWSNEEYKTKVRDAQTQLQTKEDENSKMEKALGLCKTLYDETTLNLATHKKKLDQERLQHKKETETFHQQIGEMKKALAQSKEQLTTLSTTVSNKEAENTDLDEKIRLRDEQIMELQQRYSKCKEKIDNLEAGIQQRDIIAKELGVRLKQEKQKSSEISETLQHSKEEQSELDETNKTLEEEVARLQLLTETDAHDIDDAKTNAYLNGKAEGEEKVRVKYTEEITRLESTIEERDRQIAELESAIKEREIQVAELSSRNEELEHKMETDREEISRLQQDLADKEAEHRDMSERMHTATETLENQTKEIEEKAALIQDMRNSAEESRLKIIGLEETVKRLEEECKINECKNENMIVELQAKQAEIDRLENMVEELKEANDKLRDEQNEASKTAGLKEGFEQCQQRLSKEIGDLQTKLDNEQSRNTELANEVEQCKGTLKTKDDEIKQEIMKERGNAAIYMGELEKARNDLQTMTENNSQIESENKKLKETESALEQEIVTEKRNSETLRADLVKIQIKLADIIENERKAKDELEREKIKSTQKAAKLKENQDEFSKLDKRIIEIENLNKELKQQTEVERRFAYREGYERGLLETNNETAKIISTRETDIQHLKAKLKQAEDELNKTTTAWQQEKEVTTKYNSEIQKAHAEIAQLKAANKNGSPLMIEELQQRIAISESKFEHDRGTFEKQIKSLQEELARAEQQCRDVAEENTRNVNRLAAEMNAKVSSDESSLENISIQARPMKIAEDYTWLMSNAWLDAKSALDEINSDDIGKDDKVKSEDEKVTSGSDKGTSEAEEVISKSDKVTTESGKVTLGSDKVTLGSDKVTSESDNVTSDLDKVTAKMDKMTLEADAVTSQTAMDTSEADLVTMEEGQVKVKVGAVKVEEEEVKVISEADKVKLLFDILMTCEVEAKAMLNQVFRELNNALRDPIKLLVARKPKDEATQDSKKGDLPQTMLTMIGDYFRRFSGKADLEYLQQCVVSTLEAKYKHNTTLHPAILLQIDDISYFLTETVRIAWKMAIQRPPMIFEATEIGKPWTKGSFLELTWGSNPNSPNAVIQYYKGPTLVHAGNAMVKGTVFVHREKNPE